MKGGREEGREEGEGEGEGWSNCGCRAPLPAPGFRACRYQRVVERRVESRVGGCARAHVRMHTYTWTPRHTYTHLDTPAPARTRTEG